MKHKHNNDTGAQLVPVHFEFTHPTATAVCIAGTFNKWQPEANALQTSGGGRWVKETALTPGIYEYCLVVDGQWMPDPLIRETVPNPFGGRNSVLRVISPEASHLADAENLPMIDESTSKAEKLMNADKQAVLTGLGTLAEEQAALMAAKL
jgi:1,4-alpha-glucan branching enzyme